MTKIHVHVRRFPHGWMGPACGAPRNHGAALEAFLARAKATSEAVCAHCLALVGGGKV